MRVAALVMVLLCSSVARAEDGPQMQGHAAKLKLFELDVPTNARMKTFTGSDWMAAAVTFRGVEDILYVNISVNGAWVVRNIPVLSIGGAGVVQTQWYAFGSQEELKAHGRVKYGMALSSAPSEAAPRSELTAPIQPRKTISVCIGGGPQPPAKGGTLEGGELAPNETKHVNADFPNQEAGLNECGPVALSNSLQWLNKKHNLGMADDDISIDHMKGVTGWTKKNGVTGNWIDKKANATKAKLDTLDIPVDKIGTAMDKGCDIELVADTHVAAIVGISKLATGKYAIDIAHDTQQDKKGGTTTETIIYAPGSKGIQGGTFLDGTKATSFIAECKKGTAL